MEILQKSANNILVIVKANFKSTIKFQIIEQSIINFHWYKFSTFLQSIFKKVLPVFCPLIQTLSAFCPRPLLSFLFFVENVSKVNSKVKIWENKQENDPT